MTTVSAQLQNAFQAQQQGKLDEAASLYEQILEAQPENADAIHLLGILHGQRGESERELELLEQAVSLNGEHPAYRLSLGKALKRAHKAEAALEHFEKAAELMPNAAPLHTERGFTLHELGRDEEAVAAFQESIKHDKDYVRAYCGLGNLYRDQQKFIKAEEMYRAALSREESLLDAHLGIGLVHRDQEHWKKAEEAFRKAIDIKLDWVPALNALGAVLLKQNRAVDAGQFLQRAVSKAPDDPVVRCNLGQAMIALNRLDDACEHFKKAIAVDPTSVAARTGLARAYRGQDRIQDAIAMLREAVAIDPSSELAQYMLAESLERQHETEEAQAAITKALESNPDFPLAIVMQARLERRAGKSGQARARLDSLQDRSLEPQIQAAVDNELGYVLDAMGEYDEAFKHFYKAQKLDSQQEAFRQVPKEAYPEMLEIARSRVTPESVRTWDDPEPDDVSTPIFVTGFSRSGTTLIEQMLNAHPSLRSNDERPVLSNVISKLTDLTGSYREYPDVLEDLSLEDVKTLRGAYRDRIGEAIGALQEGERFVEKQPLNWINFAMARRLFPDAPVIMMIRDPRDVVLSCFMQDFLPNFLTAHLQNIESAADIYAHAMDLWEYYKETLGQRVLEVKYEELVKDPEPILRKAFELIGVEWDDEVLRYAERARERMISTPSFEAVTRPLYTSSIGRWKNYEKHLAPILPTLDRFVKLYGYADD